jgi:hypothetical protein
MIIGEPFLAPVAIQAARAALMAPSAEAGLDIDSDFGRCLGRLLTPFDVANVQTRNQGGRFFKLPAARALKTRPPHLG